MQNPTGQNFEETIPAVIYFKKINLIKILKKL